MAQAILHDVPQKLERVGSRSPAQARKPTINGTTPCLPTPRSRSFRHNSPAVTLHHQTFPLSACWTEERACIHIGGPVIQPGNDYGTPSIMLAITERLIPASYSNIVRQHVRRPLQLWWNRYDSENVSRGVVSSAITPQYETHQNGIINSLSAHRQLKPFQH